MKQCFRIVPPAYRAKRSKFKFINKIKKMSKKKGKKKYEILKEDIEEVKQKIKTQNTENPAIIDLRKAAVTLLTSKEIIPAIGLKI